MLKKKTDGTNTRRISVTLRYQYYTTDCEFRIIYSSKDQDRIESLRGKKELIREQISSQKTRTRRRRVAVSHYAPINGGERREVPSISPFVIARLHASRSFNYQTHGTRSRRMRGNGYFIFFFRFSFLRFSLMRKSEKGGKRRRLTSFPFTGQLSRNRSRRSRTSG